MAIILLDMDNVVVEWSEKIIKWWNEDHPNNKPVVMDDITTYNIAEHFGIGAEYFVKSSCRYPDFYQNLDPMPGAIEGVKTLVKNKDHQVLFVTAVPQFAANSYHGKIAWLQKHMPFFDLKNFIACSRKEFVVGDILLDDKVENIEAFNKTGRMGILYTQPWNKSSSLKRVNNWEEALYQIHCFDSRSKIRRLK